MKISKQGASAVKHGAQAVTGFVKKVTGERHKLKPLNREEREIAQKLIDK